MGDGARVIFDFMKFTKETFSCNRIKYSSGGVDLEALLFLPSGNGPFPLVVFLHPHDANAWTESRFGYFLQKAGYAVLMPTQRGYVPSEGEPDYCGSLTQQGVLDAMEIVLQNEPLINKERIAVWGISRGAVVASLLVAKNPGRFAAAVLQSGAYDLQLVYQQTSIEGIRGLMQEEFGATESGFMERSSVGLFDEKACPVLILHGENDDRYPVDQARLLDQKLTQIGVDHQTVILLGKGHVIARDTRVEYTFPFLKKYL